MATTSYLRSRYAELVKNLTKAQKEAAQWFRAAEQYIARGKPISGHEIMKRDISRLTPVRRVSARHIGRLIMYFYDPLPLSKKTMSAYDRFPLVIPLQLQQSTKHGPGFLGMNLHYLPPKLRVAVLDDLYTIYNNKHLNEKRKIRMSYQRLKREMNNKYYKPTIHMYLFKNLKSRIYMVDPKEWDLTILLPTERFEKQSRSIVWRESKRKIGMQ